MARSLNKAQIIGNLTRDPELKYTPKGTAVCTFSVATNRTWTTDSGEKKDEVEYHRVVSWAKLAEICAQILTKGRKVYIEGRLQTRSWEGQDNVKRSQTEIVATDMLALDSRGAPTGEALLGRELGKGGVTGRFTWPRWLLEKIGQAAVDELEKEAEAGTPFGDLDDALKDLLKNLDANDEKKEVVKEVQKVYRHIPRFQKIGPGP